MMMRLCRKPTIFTRPLFLLSHTQNSTLPKHKPVEITFYLNNSSPYAHKIHPNSFFFFTHHYATQSSLKDEQDHNTNEVDLQIISEDSIKPASPTPHHLTNFKLSIFDQYMFDIYTPLILFLPNNDHSSVSDVITTRSRRLKEGLSQILTRFYPFAGEVKDNLHIECNDKGVYFVEARVDQTLQEFLGQPDDQKVRQLIPKHPSTTESSFGNYIIRVQVNIFDCGGIGLCMSTSHKIIDGHTYCMFMNSWAAATRGSPDTISPSFVASEVFPNNPSLKYSMPSKLTTTKLPSSTKRFVFDSIALTSLKAQAVATTGTPSLFNPSRMEVTTALIWKAAVKAASAVRPFGPQSPYLLLSLVNLRKRASPPFPKESIGNIIDAGFGICFPESQPDLQSLMHEIRESIAKINADHIEARKGTKGHEAVNELLKAVNNYSEVMDEGDWLFATSLLNAGMYELDFGWGKPIWFYYMSPGTPRIVALNDMKKGGGVEAVVTLSCEEMEIFERDPEVLSLASVNPSPLQFLND